jgi:integrase
VRKGEKEPLRVIHRHRPNSSTNWPITKKRFEALFLKVPRNLSQSSETDQRQAGIPKWAPGGKLDFHAMRVAYITHVIEAGADIKTAQTLARHCTPQLTLGIYARTRPERLKAMAEAVGNVFPESSKGTPPAQAANA